MLDRLFENYDCIIAIDTETTGIEPKKEKIIELSAVRLVKTNGEIVVTDELDELILLPEGRKIPEVVEKLTGITNEKLQAEGVESCRACEKFVRLFKDDKILLVAYNAQFDMNFLYYFLAEHNSADILKKIKMLDAYTVYRDRREYPHKLENAIEAYNLGDKVVNSHRAIDDTLALVEVLKAMEEERSDLHLYINLFGYNPKYGVSGSKISSVRYVPQPYNSPRKLYEEL